MVMLSPAEFAAGGIADAQADGLTLMLPRSQYDLTLLIAGRGGEKLCVYLNDLARVDAFEWSEDDDRLEGILVPCISIELDSQSVFDPRSGLIGGCLLRTGSELKIYAGHTGSRMGRPRRHTLLTGLPPCAENQDVGFRKWRIVIGCGDEKRELFAANIPVPPDPHA